MDTQSSESVPAAASAPMSGSSRRSSACGSSRAVQPSTTNREHLRLGTGTTVAAVAIMLRGEILVGRISDIEIRLHYSWFIIAALLTVSLAAHLYAVNAEWSAVLVWTAATVTALAFFGAILLHELSHAAVARARGLPVPAITLFALGGLARLGRDTADPPTEFWMGLAGPAMSVLIGMAALALAVVTGWNREATPDTAGMVMLVWFGFINLTLAAFNMIPGFPLDGGRVLRAGLWWWSGDRARATRIAAGVGRVVAFAFIVFGVSSFVRGAGFGGLWLAFIGFFLASAARAAARETTASEALRNIRVGDVMSRDCATVRRAAPLSVIASDVLRTGTRCFFVSDDGHLAGMITPQELRAVPRADWDVTPACEAMRPLDQLRRVSAGASVAEALELIGRENVSQLPVIEDGTLRGVISRDQIQRLITARAELGAS